jgi:hypothetical protein
MENEERNRRTYDAEVAVLKAKLESFMETTTEYRKALCAKLDVVLSKIDVINEKLAKLPCEEGEKTYKDLRFQLYSFIGVFSAILITVFIKWITQ